MWRVDCDPHNNTAERQQRQSCLAIGSRLRRECMLNKHLGETGIISEEESPQKGNSLISTLQS